MLESNDDKATVDYAGADAPCRRRPFGGLPDRAGISAGHVKMVGAHGVLIARPAPNCLPVRFALAKRKLARSVGVEIVGRVEGAHGELGVLSGHQNADLDLRS